MNPTWHIGKAPAVHFGQVWKNRRNLNVKGCVLRVPLHTPEEMTLRRQYIVHLIFKLTDGRAVQTRKQL